METRLSSGPSRANLSRLASSQVSSAHLSLRSYHLLPGETLTFDWNGGHNVERVSQEGYENCSGFKSDEAVKGPFEFKTSTAGEYYFVCGVGGHCEFGNQKAIVTVDRQC